MLAILTTAPIRALGIGLAGPRLLARQVKGQCTHIYFGLFTFDGLKSHLTTLLILISADETEGEDTTLSVTGHEKDNGTLESKL